MRIGVELRCLIRPGSAIVAAMFLSLVFVAVGLHQADAHSHWRGMANAHTTIQEQRRECQLGEASDSFCARAARDARAGQAKLAGQVRQRFSTASAVLQPLGALGVASGFIASVPGVLAIAALGSLHVAGEWSGGTIRVRLARGLRPFSFVVGKALSLFTSAILLTVLAAAALVAVSWLLKAVYDIPPSPANFDATAYAFQQAGRSVLVVAATSALTAAAAVWTRSSFGTVAFLSVGLFSGVTLVSFVSTVKFSPVFWVAEWMHFVPGRFMGDHIWPDRFPLSAPDPDIAMGAVQASTLLILSLGVFTLIGWLGLRIRDV